MGSGDQFGPLLLARQALHQLNHVLSSWTSDRIKPNQREELKRPPLLWKVKGFYKHKQCSRNNSLPTSAPLWKYASCEVSVAPHILHTSRLACVESRMSFKLWHVSVSAFPVKQRKQWEWIAASCVPLWHSRGFIWIKKCSCLQNLRRGESNVTGTRLRITLWTWVSSYISSCIREWKQERLRSCES